MTERHSFYDEILTSLLNGLSANWPIWTFLLVFVALRLLFTSSRFKGWWGEQLVERFGLRRLDAARYHVFNDLYLPRPDGAGTTQIDHLVVSRFGVFVIETKNYRGWIFGSEKQRKWTQQINRRKKQFQSPIHQNQLHINALSHFLDLDKDRFHSVIFFTGDCTLKTPLPDFVLTRGLRGYIESFNDERLTREEVEQASANLRDHVTGMDKRAVAKAHRRQFERA